MYSSNVQTIPSVSASTREINTLGSKANHKELQKLVVEMKDELERIKEQVLNVL